MEPDPGTARSGADDVIARARAGDEDAWRTLYDAHGRRLVVWLRSTPSADAAIAAEDIAAEAWTVAAAKVGEFTGSVGEFGGWLIAIAKNVAANHQRRAHRRQTYPSDDPGAFLTARMDGPEVAAQSDDTTRRLLAHLSPREAEVIACIDVVGLDVKATARALGLSPTAVRVARHRGLGRLRRVLGETGEQVS